jgi:hypothetical protein
MIKRLFLAALLLSAAAGQASPTIVARKDFVNQTSDISTTTLYTVPVGAAGVYRITESGETCQPGNNGVITPVFSWTAIDGKSDATNFGRGTPINSLGGVAPCDTTFGFYNSNVFTINPKDGTTISFSSSGNQSGGTFSFYIRIEKL